MEEEVKKIYTQLTGGKKIIDENQIISTRDFNSINGDRFVSNLNNYSIKWDGRDITFKKLLSNSETISTNYKNHIQIENESDKNIVRSSIGIDIQDLSELPKVNDFWENEFYKSKFTPNEIAYALTKENPLETFAGLYACKEAIIKSNNKIKWDEINIKHDEYGKPFFLNYSISISHSGNFATSVCFNEVETPPIKDTTEFKNEIITTDFKILFFTILVTIFVLIIIYFVQLFN